MNNYMQPNNLVWPSPDMPIGIGGRNADMTVLRIFSDYIDEMSGEKSVQRAGIKHFQGKCLVQFQERL